MIKAGLTPIVIFNFIMLLFFTLAYFYQFVYILHVWRRGDVKIPPAKKQHCYAFVIAAHNEEPVIGNLVRSILSQNYPRELMDVYVVADACTDNTYKEALDAGAITWERNDLVRKGKSWVLDYAFNRILDETGDKYDGFFVFDADNIVSPDYTKIMNDAFDQGYLVLTSYRNSKNFDSSWVSAAYALWFLREAKFLSQARLNLNTSCAISGTGFFISAEIIDAVGGWKWHLLTEDIEFSAASIIDGVRISYCPTAVLYDEQPITFRDSWNQRFRWAKGFYQVFGKYAGGLVKGIFTQSKGHRFACYDMLMTISPAMLLTIISVTFNAIILVLGLTGAMSTGVMVASSLSSISFCLLSYILFMFLLGVLTTFVEWDSIHSTTSKKIRYMFTFPLFMITYIPIALVALVKKAEWKPIKHSIVMSAEDFGEAKTSDTLVVSANAER